MDLSLFCKYYWKTGGKMKKAIIFSISCWMILSFLAACRPKQEEISLPPPLPEPTTPATPQEKEQPTIEKVEIPKEADKTVVIQDERRRDEISEVPIVREYELTEEEIFRNKSLEEINRELPLTMLLFDYDEFYIREDAKRILEANSVWLKKFPTSKILIEGHCDERGTEEYNLALGERRANSALDYLVSLGISADRITIISYGKSQPLDQGHNEMAWQTNRRSEFLIIGK